MQVTHSSLYRCPCCGLYSVLMVSTTRNLTPHPTVRASLHYRLLTAIQIGWKFRLVVIPLLAIRSQQNHCIKIEMKVKRNLHRIGIAMDKPSVIRAPRPYFDVLLHATETHTLYYNDVIMNAMGYRLFAQLFIQAQIDENVKTPRHWTL